jgi:hypothetical protein
MKVILPAQTTVVVPIVKNYPWLAKVIATAQTKMSHHPHVSITANTKHSGAVVIRVRHAEIPQMGHINAESALFISIPSAASPFQERRKGMGNYGYAWSAKHPKELTKGVRKITATVLLTPVLLEMIPTFCTDTTTALKKHQIVGLEHTENRISLRDNGSCARMA